MKLATIELKSKNPEKRTLFFTPKKIKTRKTDNLKTKKIKVPGTWIFVSMVFYVLL